MEEPLRVARKTKLETLTMRIAGRQDYLKKLLLSTALCSLAVGADGAFNPSEAQSFSSQELANSTGLDQIRAAEGYALITGAEGGQGVVIAIIDSGIDETHPDLAPNLIDSFLIGDATDVAGEHGTAVAGIAAGATNNGGTMGVAYNAGIVAYQAGDIDPDTPNQIIFDNDATATSINAAGGGSSVANTEADILNLSLGAPLTGPLRLNTGEVVAPAINYASPEIRDALRVAVGNGKLVVVAAGNDFDALPALEDSLGVPRGTIVDIGAIFPAQFASDPDLAGGMIAVMAVDQNNQRAFFSNSCLGVQNRCLAAPGVNFQGALPGGGTGGIGNGTSYAAPLVSGAAAVVQAAFGVSPQEAGNRLLTTATDLGAAGVNSVYGHGLLNLENALTPQGQLTVALGSSTSGPKQALAGSTLSLGNALALNGAGADLLADAVTLDDDNFPFAVDLSRSTAVQSRTTGLNAFIGSNDRKTSLIATENGTLALSLAEDRELDDPYRAEFATNETALKEEADLPTMQMQSELTEDVDLFFGFNSTSDAASGLASSLPEGGDFFQPTAFLAPFDQLAGLQHGGGTTLELGDNTDLTIAAFSSADNDTTRQSVMQKVELKHKTVGDIELRLGYGFMQEDGGFLGSEARGAFGADSGGNSQYLDVSVLAPLSDKVSLFGAYTQGNTEASGGGNSLLSNYSAIRSEAFGAGLVMTDIAEKGDGFTLMIGQPLRVQDGSAEVTVPVGRNQDGTIVKEDATLDLSPAGREIAIETVYNVALDDDNQSLSAGSFVRLNPNHDPNADPDVGVGLSYKLKF